MVVVRPEALAICRLPAGDRVPSWALELHHGFLSLTRTPEELSIVCPEAAVPPEVDVDTGWRAITVDGRLGSALAGIPALTVSTRDADHVLVRAADLDRALAALHAAAPDAPPPGGRARISSGSRFEPRIGFSRALRTGRRVLVSGTGPVQPDGGCPEGTLAQARRCWDIVLEALADAGAGARDVVRTRTFLAPAADPEGAMAAHREVFGDVRPAATMLTVHSLLDSRWTVEVEAEAEI